MRVKDIMTESVAYCTPETPLKQVARKMLTHDCGALPVLDDLDHNQPMGIITDRDIVCRTLALGKNPSDMTAGECMTCPAISVHPEDSIEECCNLLEDHQVRRAVVIDDTGCCCGMISQADIARYAGEHQTAELLEEVSQPV